MCFSFCFLKKNRFGQLGINEKKTRNVVTPKLIEFFSGMKIENFFCGSYHTFVLAKSGNGRTKCYSFGNNASGQLSVVNPAGADDAILFEPKETKLPESIKRIKSIACGEGFSLLLTDDGRGYSFFVFLFFSFAVSSFSIF